MNIKDESSSPTITVAVAPSKPAAVVKGFDVPPYNNTINKVANGK